jgi:hypothetical protein
LGHGSKPINGSKHQTNLPRIADVGSAEFGFLAQRRRLLLCRSNSIATTLEFRHGIVKRKLQNVIIDAIGRESARLGRIVSPCDHGIHAVQSTEKYILKFCNSGAGLGIELPGTHTRVLASVAYIVRATSPNCKTTLVWFLGVKHFKSSSCFVCLYAISTSPDSLAWAMALIARALICCSAHLAKLASDGSLIPRNLFL